MSQPPGPPGGPPPPPPFGPPPPGPGSQRPQWARKRVVLPVLAVLAFLSWVIGFGMGAAGESSADVAPKRAAPRPTVTVSATETVTATPEPEGTKTVEATTTVTATKTVEAAPAAPEEDIPEDVPEDAPDTSVYYENCDAARAAGAAPVHRGDPGYARHLDRDGDGVGCEWS
jgi:hypothetical protein